MQVRVLFPLNKQKETIMFEAKILADSLHPVTTATGSRLTTMELTYPRCIHSEFMTHRMFSRNAASSRAIPVKTMIERVAKDPFIPLVWGTNKPGMQAGVEHTGPEVCDAQWRVGLRHALSAAERMNRLGLHKQIINRVLEPYAWITVIVTGVDHAWENFFGLRCHPDAEPHIQHIAYMARRLYDANTPEMIHIATVTGAYHLPLTGFEGDDDLDDNQLIMASVARCARVSYLTHDDKRDVGADLSLHDRLVEAGHWSPFEHVACPSMSPGRYGANFGPWWVQYRKTFQSEYIRERG